MSAPTAKEERKIKINITELDYSSSSSSVISSHTKHTKISSADQGIGSHYYFLYSRSEEKVVGVLGS